MQEPIDDEHPDEVVYLSIEHYLMQHPERTADFNGPFDEGYQNWLHQHYLGHPQASKDDEW